MGRAAGTLGPVPAAAVEGQVAMEPAEGPVAAGPAAEGPTVGGVGPWRTRDLKE